jgi:hypothetical protein
MKKLIYIFILVLSVQGLSSCKGGTNPSLTGSNAEYFVSAWSELSMRPLTPSDNKPIILQPSNNLIVRVVKRGNPPKPATNGITVSYEITNYKTSDNSNSEPEGKVIYSGNMVESKGLFIAEGIQPILNDNGNSCQSANIAVKTTDGRIITYAHLIIPAFDTNRGELTVIKAQVSGKSLPPCEICHYGMNWTNPGEVFYGKPKGKGNPFCIACHQSRLSSTSGL